MKYDVVVIGGGPAGMMAAGRAGEFGARVVLVEKNASLGKKLLICGKGRCNLTNNLFELKEMISCYGINGKFLFSSFYKFGPDELINFFKEKGLETKTEKNGRVFPCSDKSVDVLNVMINYLSSSNVEVRMSANVKKIILNGLMIEKIILDNGEEIFADKFILSTGGKAYPVTGSTGDAYAWLMKLGHKIVKPFPALSPVILNEEFIKDLEGVSLKDVRVSVYKKNKKVDSRIGDVIFTAEGISGPAILDMSKIIGQNLPDEVELRIDFSPLRDVEDLVKNIQENFDKNPNKAIKNILSDFFPQKLMLIFIKYLEIDADRKANSILKPERTEIVRLFKEFRLKVKGLAGFDKAMITSGGVDLKEVDPKTMLSKIISNLFLAGEVLDIDGPTGGYNLQVCWSTGYAAGEASVMLIEKK